MRAIGYLLDNSKPMSFMRRNFDIKWFASTNLDLTRSVLGRIKNQFAKAITELKIFLKLIIIIPDCDLIESLPTNKFGVSEIYGRIIHWLAAEFDKFIGIHKERLPQKSVKAEYPSFLWIPPAQNVNFSNHSLRGKFAKSLKSSLEIMPNHMMLKLIKVWNYEDSTLARNNNYTTPGFIKFWESLDSAEQFWCKTLAPGRNTNTTNSLSTY